MDKEFLKNTVKKSNADFTEIRIEDKAYTVISYKGKNLEHIQSLHDRGGIVRTLVNGAWAATTFNDLENIEHAIERTTKNAQAIAHMLPQDKKVNLCPVPSITDIVKARLDKDFRDVSL